jgi:folate-binding protein YgfZ
MPTTPPHDVALSPQHAEQAASVSLSDKVRDEFRALTSTCGIYDLASRAKIQLTGNDRVRWLNGMLTNNIRDLAVGHGVYAFLLNPQGHILGDLYAYNRGEAILVDTDRSQLEKILATFDHYIIMDDVEVTNLNEQMTAVGLAGPDAKRVLEAAGFNVPALQPLQVADVEWNGIATIMIAGEQERYPSFEVWHAPDKSRDALAALEHAGGKRVSSEALELYRVALGIPRYGQDIRERDLPQETEQQRALNFSKGCYVGQEIVERIRSRGNVHRKFTGFRLEGSQPRPGASIQLPDQDKEIGLITSVAVIPAASGDQAVALGYIRREASGEGKEVRIGESSARVAELPFHDLLVQ